MLHAEAVHDRDFERSRAATMRFNFARGFFRQIVTRVVIERDVGAFARKDVAERGANPSRSAGDERAFTFK